MPTTDSRQSLWNQLQQKWDLIIIGGGITGAGIFRRACAGGWRTLLLEAADFSSGTSSKSSKLVHGGFRYLRNRQFDVTFESVRQRELLLRQAPHLVSSMGFYLPYQTDLQQKRIFGLGVAIYDLMAPKWKHRHLNLRELDKHMPLLKPRGMRGAYLYYDAVVDDSRLVLRLIQESAASGGLALNYAKVSSLLRGKTGEVCGVAVEDRSGQSLGTLELQAGVVINATGPWTDSVRQQLRDHSRVRPLRGSHLVFGYDDLPIPYSVTLMHPQDSRAMFAIPWEGRTIFGTTDLDHSYSLSLEPFCTNDEIEYMLTAVNSIFPTVNLDRTKIISSFAGLRPIVRGDASNPSAESRAHLILEEDGLITITGGKLTIFEIMAEDALKAAAARLKKDLVPIRHWFDPISLPNEGENLCEHTSCYLAGRYGKQASALVSETDPSQLEQIEDLYTVWAEVGFNARNGLVEHLDDLLLRRTRLGMLLPNGAVALLPKIKPIVQNALRWDEPRWQREVNRYQQIYRQAFSPDPENHQA